MKLADSSIIAAFELFLHEIEDDGIAEPGADIGANEVRPDERHDPQAFRLRIDKRMRACVGTTGCKNAGHAMLPEQRQHLIELVVRLRLPIVVQMCVEDFDGFSRSDPFACNSK